MIKVEGSILNIEGFGHFNMYNVSHISELEEYCDGPNMELYFSIDNVKISEKIYDDVKEEEFRHLYNEIISIFYEINKIIKH